MPLAARDDGPLEPAPVTLLVERVGAELERRARRYTFPAHFHLDAIAAMWFDVQQLLETSHRRRAGAGDDDRLGLGLEDRLATPGATSDNVQGAFDGQAFGEVLIVRQQRAAVARAEAARDNLDAEAVRDLFHLLQPLEVGRGLAVDLVETRGQHYAVQAVRRGGLDDLTDLNQVVVRGQPGADIDPAFWIDLFRGRLRGQKRTEQSTEEHAG